jgi:voltage-gated potassium channel
MNALTHKLRTLPRWAELSIKALIIYSVATYLIEADYLRPSSDPRARLFFLWSERIIGTLFTVEYFARWTRAKDRRHYPLRGMALVDLVAVLPFWLELVIGSHALGPFRLLRVVRLAKYSRYNDTLIALGRSLYHVRRQLYALAEVIIMVVVFGAVIMHAVEAQTQPKTFGTVGNSMWWTFVTLTTVGYGDAYPVTNLGKTAAAAIMVVGLGVVGTFLGLFVNACSDAIHPERGDG